MAADAKHPIPPDLFDLLCCPFCAHALRWHEGRLVCTDAACRRSWPVEGDVPILLPERAVVESPQRWAAIEALGGPVGAGAAAVRARHGLRTR